jgi:hypothetical protein
MAISGERGRGSRRIGEVRQTDVEDMRVVRNWYFTNTVSLSRTRCPGKCWCRGQEDGVRAKMPQEWSGEMAVAPVAGPMLSGSLEGLPEPFPAQARHDVTVAVREPPDARNGVGQLNEPAGVFDQHHRVGRPVPDFNRCYDLQRIASSQAHPLGC